MKAPLAQPSLPELRRGAKGPNVRILQSALTSRGFVVMIDGDFGPKTQSTVAYFQQTHLGPDGEYLSRHEPLGVVTPNTWWALNSTAEEQRSNLDTFIPTGLSAQRRSILRVALQEHSAGVREVPDGSNYGDGVTKYLTGVGPAFWCCYAVHWWVNKALGHYPLGERRGLCLDFWNDAKRMGRTYSPASIPVPGDAFVILYRADGQLTGSGHTGIVACTSADGARFGTFAGNEGNRVKAGIRRTDEPILAGFIDMVGDTNTIRDKFARGLFFIGSNSDNSIGSTR